jgi:hypothetical protein
MQQRTIFPEVALVKKDLMERFLVSLREIYRNHPTYTYADNELETGIHIQPSYADLAMPGKKPRLIIKPGGYDFSLTDTLFHNMSGEAKNPAGITAGYAYQKMSSSSVTIVVDAYAEEESSDVADELAMLMAFVCRGMFGQNAIAIRGVAVSVTEVLDQAQGLYRTMVSVPFEFAWQGEITSNASSVLRTDTIFEPLETPGTSRTPGVEAYRQYLKQQQSL